MLETDATHGLVEEPVAEPAVDAHVPEVTTPQPLSPLLDGAKVLAGYLELDRRERARRDEIVHRRMVLRRTLAFADIATLATVLFIGAGLMAGERLSLWAPLVTVGLILVMKALGLYDRDEHRLHRTTLDEIPRLFQVATLCTLMIWLLGDPLVVGGDFERDHVLQIWLLLLSLLIVGRSLARYLASRFTAPERCLVIGDAEAADAVQAKLKLTGTHPAEVVAWLEGKTVAGGSGGSRPVLPHGLYGVMAEKCIHRVIVAPGKVDGDALLHMVRELSDMHVSASVLPATPPVAGSSVELDDLHGLTLLGVKTFEMNRSSRILKRGFDVATSSIALVMLSPLLAAIALAIKLDSRGPVLFRQKRIGRHGHAFEILKFRSMFDGSHELRESPAGAEHRGRRLLQGRAGPAGHQDREGSARLVAGRAAAARQRPARGDEPGRPPAARPRRGLAGRGLLPRAPRHRAWNHRLLAGAGLLSRSALRDGPPRLSLRRHLVFVERPADPPADDPLRHRPPRRLNVTRGAARRSRCMGMRRAIALACIAALLLAGCGEKDEPAPASGDPVFDLSQYSGEEREVARTIALYAQLVGDGRKEQLCSQVMDLGGKDGRGDPGSVEDCNAVPDLGVVWGDAELIAVQSILFRSPGNNGRGENRRAVTARVGTRGEGDRRLKFILEKLAGEWRVRYVSVVLPREECRLRFSEIADGIATPYKNSRDALLQGLYGDGIRRALRQEARLVPVAESLSDWSWALLREGRTRITYGVEGNPPRYSASSRSGCQPGAVSDRNQPPGSVTPDPLDPCAAIDTPEGAPRTVTVKARAWFAAEGVVRAMYPASGSNEPCELRIAEGPGGRVVVRVLNPRIATSDLRYWCVESRLPLAAPDIAPARNLDRVDPGIKRQLRSGRGCVRVPYAPG